MGYYQRKLMNSKYKVFDLRQKATAHLDPEKTKLKNRTRNYGITVEDFEKMWIEQNQSCKICKKQYKRKSNLHIDHCHKTGKVRGLLCGTCNKGLGFFKDKIEFLLVAIEYLRGN